MTVRSTLHRGCPRHFAATLAAALCLAGSQARAGAPQAYLAERTRDIAAANATHPTSDTAQARALGDLERRLKAFVPPWHADGFVDEGKSNLATLTREQGFGQLDGLVYASRDAKTSVLVTTPELLEAWIAGHEKWWPDDLLPQTLDAALTSEAFYTQAISTDAAYARFAELPIARPADAAAAFAMIDLRRQDVAPDMPGEITTTVVRADRVVIATRPIAPPLAPIPACETVWASGKAKADAVLAAAQAKGDDKGVEAADAHLAEADRDNRRCIAKHLKEQPAFKALIAQAQSLIDLP